MIPDIPPNASLNKLRACIIGAMGFIALGVVGLIGTIPGDLRWGAMAVPFLIAMAIFWYSWRLFYRPPKSGARIVFTQDGFDLSVKQAFRSLRTMSFKWAELEQIVYVAGGYGVRFFEFKVTDDAAKRMGHIQPTAKENRPEIFGFRTLSAPVVLFGPNWDDVIARLSDAAAQHGYVVEKLKFRMGPFYNRTTYSVTKSQ